MRYCGTFVSYTDTIIIHGLYDVIEIGFLLQVRSQEEIMNECQVWWTITGNFGNMMPIDWSKSTTRAKQLPTLNLVRSHLFRHRELNSHLFFSDRCLL
jgi:hypothetical protein